MINKQKKVLEWQKNVDFDIVHWRERFAELKDRAPKNWMKSLAESNTAYDTYEGTITMQAVANNRAGLAKTAQLVQDLEEMLTAPPKPNSMFEKWKNKQLLTGK